MKFKISHIKYSLWNTSWCYSPLSLILQQSWDEITARVLTANAFYLKVFDDFHILRCKFHSVLPFCFKVNINGINSFLVVRCGKTFNNRTFVSWFVGFSCWGWCYYLSYRVSKRNEILLHTSLRSLWKLISWNSSYSTSYKK